MHRSQHMSRQASARIFPARVPARALCRSSRAMPLASGSRVGRLLYSTGSVPRPADVTLAALHRADTIITVVGSASISASATAAWSMWCYNKCTMDHLFNASTRFAQAVCSGAVAGFCVTAAGAFLAPTALALGPCLGMALLTVPVTGIVQAAIGFAYVRNIAHGGNNRQWFTETVLTL
nr:hypothetical protein [Pandoravirus massiliensis]